jgi:hypothetical protein
MRASADIGVTSITPTVIATRGERLALGQVRFSGRDQRPEAFHIAALGILEINADSQIGARIVFDLDDIDAAFEELDARYLAGEAAAHSHTWSVIAQAYAAINRRELPATTPDWVNVDHRHVTSMVPGDLTANIRASWDLMPDITTYIEAVHRLGNLGAVYTRVVYGTSEAGFDAEWREIELSTVDGDLINRCEKWEEADLDTALAKFDELGRPAPRLENAASQVYERIFAYFAARDWDSVREILAEDISTDDRRRVVNAGRRQGRDAVIAEISAIAEVGVTRLTSEIIATRGGHLVLSRGRASEADQRPEAFRTDLLDIVEVDADERVVARVVFDIDDIDAAFEELDARYLAGEAAAHAHTWSVIAGACAAVNRRELPATTPDWVNIDHRRAIAFAPGDMTAYIHATWDATPDSTIYIEAVHRLSNFGAIVTQVGHEVSQHGFEAEWRMINLLTVEGELLNRTELFDEADLDAALARFDELSRPVTRLENAASQVYERFWAYFAARDRDAMAEMLGDDPCTEDRRRVVNSGIRHGRDATLAEISALIEVGLKDVTLDVIATRGDRLALSRARYSGSDERPEEAFHSDLLDLVEIDADERVAAIVAFDPDDIDAAFEELDARYLAGEAAEHSQVWSVIARTYATFNRRELPPTTPDWVNIDHRRATSFAPGDTTAYLHATWDVAPDINIYIEAVHRLSDIGGVIAHAAHGTSQEGFDAEWREITVFTVDGDLISRAEIFDEAEIDAALARFDELSRPLPRLENAASRVDERFRACFGARDWAATAETLADDFCTDDRRRVVNVGTRHGRDAEIANARALAELGTTTITSTVIATRGDRLALSRHRVLGRDQRPEAFHMEVLGILEINADSQIGARIVFDLDDIDAAIAELDARYLAGEAATYAHTWSLIADAYAALNRPELLATTPDWVNIDHRRLTTIEAGDLIASFRAAREVVPDLTVYIEAVHRLSDLGAVVTHAAYGTSHEGFAAEWRGIALLTLDGDLFNRGELFDETDLDAALARLEELSRPA